jgi:hypothetical protein
MRIKKINGFNRKYVVVCMLWLIAFTVTKAQEPISRTPEEQRELFNFCDKPELIKRFKLTESLADKVGDLQLWATKQQLSITANTNEQFATTGEMEQELAKKYKSLGLNPEQIKGAIDYKHERESGTAPCAAIELKYNHSYDTLTPQRALQLFKTKYRKLLIDKLGETGNGRQADMLFETEVWKQKESLVIAAIPEADFNRIRRTVSMYKEREGKYKAIGMSDSQIDTVIQFFNEHQLYPK